MRSQQRACSGCLIGVCLLLAACSSPSKRVYQPNPADPSVQPLPLKIAVVELEDGSKETGWRKDIAFNEGLIPLTASNTLDVKFNDTRYGRCLFAELKASQQFSAVDYHENWEKLAEQFKVYDLILTGHLHHDRVEAARHFYGLGFFGVYLWFIGFPEYSYSRDIFFDVGAFKPFNPDEMLWSSEVKTKDKSYSNGFFYGKGRDGYDLIQKLDGVGVNTDFCPSEILQPHFLALRNKLAVAFRDGVLAKGTANLPKK